MHEVWRQQCFCHLSQCPLSLPLYSLYWIPLRFQTAAVVYSSGRDVYPGRCVHRSVVLIKNSFDHLLKRSRAGRASAKAAGLKSTSALRVSLILTTSKSERLTANFYGFLRLRRAFSACDKLVNMVNHLKSVSRTDWPKSESLTINNRFVRWPEALKQLAG